MQLGFITSNPKILKGKPIIKDSRISVEFVTEWLASGGTVESFYKEYDYLPKGSVEEHIRYVSR